jgi:tetratricopeptide (TPR) repeat protein
MRKLHPFQEPNNWSVNQFLNEVKKVIAGYYNDEGFRLMRSNRYKEAIEYFETALSYNRSDDYAYGCLGICYHNMGSTRHDINMIKKAIDYYQISLKINPNQNNIQNNLRTLTSARR